MQEQHLTAPSICASAEIRVTVIDLWSSSLDYVSSCNIGRAVTFRVNKDDSIYKEVINVWAETKWNKQSRKETKEDCGGKRIAIFPDRVP